MAVDFSSKYLIHSMSVTDCVGQLCHCQTRKSCVCVSGLLSLESAASCFALSRNNCLTWLSWRTCSSGTHFNLKNGWPDFGRQNMIIGHVINVTYHNIKLRG